MKVSDRLVKGAHASGLHHVFEVLLLRAPMLKRLVRDRASKVECDKQRRIRRLDVRQVSAVAAFEFQIRHSHVERSRRLALT